MSYLRLLVVHLHHEMVSLTLHLRSAILMVPQFTVEVQLTHMIPQ